jgi:predicted nucleotidyltransferase
MINLNSKLRQNLLAYYFMDPSANHYVRELAVLLKVDPTNLSKELNRLEQMGLFMSRFRGNQKFFSLDRTYPLFREIRSIVLKTSGVVPRLRRSLSEVPGIKEAYLYGSYAKGEQDNKSDIDVLIIGTPDQTKLESAMRKLERMFSREIHFILMDEPEFNAKLERTDPFFEDIWHGKKINLLAA